MKPFHPLSLAMALALPGMALPGMALAQQPATELDEVVVTATRTAVPVQDSVVPVQVIDRATIERSQATSLIQLLQGRAGIGLTNQGGAGKLSSLFLRGTNSAHTLVLVDGVRMGSANNGMPTPQDLPLEQIERIEIVRGPRSSLYGSEAIGGVIQVFTRAAARGLQQNLSLTAGSNQLRQASAGFSQRGERGWISAQGAWQATDGIDACRGTAAGWGAGCYADEPDRDGYRNTSLNLRGGYALTGTMQLEAHLLDVSSFNEYDGSIFGGNEAENRQQVLGGKLRWNPLDALTVTAQAGRTRDEADNYFADAGSRVFASRFETRRDIASLQADHQLADTQLVTAGADWYEDRIASDLVFDRSHRDNLGVFVEYQGRFGAHTLQASVRNDENQQFGNHATGSVGWGWALDHGLRLTASVGTGFKAPTFNDLYYPGFSNPALKPEESRSANLGIAQHGEGWRWGIDAYETHIEQLIGYDDSFNLVNVNQARIRGVEATGFVTVAGWDIEAQASFTDPRDRTAGSHTHDNWLIRRARSSARLDVDRRFGALRAGVTVIGNGHRFDDAANSVRLAGYGTVDLRLEYAINPAWTLQARASNVFDRQYETIAWYNQPGREYQLGLRYRSAN